MHDERVIVARERLLKRARHPESSQVAGPLLLL